MSSVEPITISRRDRGAYATKEYYIDESGTVYSQAAITLRVGGDEFITYLSAQRVYLLMKLLEVTDVLNKKDAPEGDGQGTQRGDRSTTS